MRFEVKRTLVAALVGVALAWPAVHPLLVQQMRSNPWHLFGMAMYTVPHRVSSIRIVRIVDGKRQQFESQGITPELEQRLKEFVDHVQGQGVMAPTPRLHPLAGGKITPGQGAPKGLAIQSTGMDGTNTE